MNFLCFKGYYKYKGFAKGISGLTGVLEFNNDASFEGLFCDHEIYVSNEFVKGQVFQDNKFKKLFLLKYPSNMTVSNLAYALFKDRSNSIEGIYRGHLKTLPYRLSIELSSEELVKTIEDSFKSDVYLNSIEDLAELYIFKG